MVPFGGRGVGRRDGIYESYALNRVPIKERKKIQFSSQE
jgi:hypothetical protein